MTISSPGPISSRVVGRRVQLKKAGREFKACCPFHDEKTPSFTVSPNKGFYHCFGCGAHGTAVGFLMDYDHMSFVEAIESLAAMLGVDVPRAASDQPARRYDELFSLLDTVARFWQEQLKATPAAVAYLQQRGIDGATAKRFGIGYAPAGWNTVLDKFGQSDEAVERLLTTGLIIQKDNGKHYDRFRERIVFPIRDARGRTIGFGGRTLGDGEPKYLNSPETVLFHKGRELYGLYEARQALRQIDRLVVVEGYMDCIGLARHGIAFAAATLGTATTADHLNRLFRLCDDVSFAFDGDRAGRQAAWRALENALPQIREGRQIRFVFLPDGQDPDSYVNEHGAAAFEKLLDAGLPLSEFLLQELAAQVDTTSVDGRARLAELARPLVARIPDGPYRALLVEALGEVVGLSGDKLASMLTSKPGEAGVTRAAAGIVSTGRRAPQPGQPSVVRRALTLLLHEPRAAVAVRYGRPREGGAARCGPAARVDTRRAGRACNRHRRAAGTLQARRRRPPPRQAGGAAGARRGRLRRECRVRAVYRTAGTDRPQGAHRIPDFEAAPGGLVGGRKSRAPGLVESGLIGRR